MKRIFLTLLLLSISIQAFAASQWNDVKPISSDNPVNYPADSQANNAAVARLLGNYKQSQTLVYKDSANLTVTAGEISVNGTSPIIMRQNTSDTTINLANLDTGSSFSVSTTYYVYAIADTNATTNTYMISLSSTMPSGATNYRQIGNFTTGSDSSILAYTIHQKLSDPLIVGVYNYGTSYSSSTLVTGSLKIAYGQSTSVSGSSSQAITNLPFTSSSSYSCSCSQSSTTTYNESPSIVINSGTQATIYNHHSDNTSGNGNCNWTCIGT